LRTDYYIKENIERNDELDKGYNPFIGADSPIERFAFHIEPGVTIYLPVHLKEDNRMKPYLQYETLEHYRVNECNKKKLTLVIQDVFDIREDYDFEYWCAFKVKIKPKTGGDYIAFSLNTPQRKVLTELEKMRANNLPVRMIILKSRQWGGSTLVQIYMAWIQIKHKTNWNSLIAAEINQQATNIRFMYSNLIKHYPDNITLKPFEGMNNIKWIPERKNKITVGSMQTPESIRSDDIAMSHLSEVGLWKKTEGKEPGDLAQAIQGTIPSEPYTVYVLESTAKGIGNFFHRSYQNAVNGINNLTPVFVAWYEIEAYRASFDDQEEKVSFVKSLTEYDKWLWKLGATLEGIKWYRFKLAEFEGDEWRMKSEFPSSATEAFQSTGRRVYAPSIVALTRSNCKPAVFKGHLYADSHKGKYALKNITFEDSDKGDLWVWEMPDKHQNIEHRYLLSVDIGGKTKTADYSVIRVLDRYWRMHGGVSEFVATWKFHADQDITVWRAIQLGEFYNHAEVAFENNSLKKHQNTEGEGFLTALNEVAENYDNLYIRSSSQEQVREGMPIKYGFHTNVASKDMIINTKNAAMRDGEYIERDSRSCDESDTFERKVDGKAGAMDGCHDDIEMSTNIGLWIDLYDKPLPYKVSTDDSLRSRIKSKNRIRSEASF